MARESVAQQVARAQSAVGQEAMRFYRLFGVAVSARIIRRTPRKTGRAQGNWRAKIGRAMPGRSWTEAGENTLPQIASTFQQAQLGQRVYVTNSVPYIGVLEHGRQGSVLTATTRGDTRQKGHFMVALTVAEAQQIGNQVSAQVSGGQ
jgi:hypothetical protein